MEQLGVIMSSTFYSTFDSPIGIIHLEAYPTHLTYCQFTQPESLVNNQQSNIIIEKTKQELSDYFTGQLKIFSVPFVLEGTEFQKKVWNCLIDIPFAQTRCYQEIALRINNPTAVRAVGRTNGLNPIAIIVPCHRVIGKNGSLTGYAGGLERKRWLLEHESLT